MSLLNGERLAAGIVLTLKSLTQLTDAGTTTVVKSQGHAAKIVDQHQCVNNSFLPGGAQKPRKPHGSNT
jgi:hypothetical protein